MGTSTTSKLSGVGSPWGRDFSRTRRLVSAMRSSVFDPRRYHARADLLSQRRAGRHVAQVLVAAVPLELEQVVGDQPGNGDRLDAHAVIVELDGEQADDGFGTLLWWYEEGRGRRPDMAHPLPHD